MSDSRPTILFTHGMYHTPTHYTDLLSALRTTHVVHAPQLPSSDPAFTNAGTVSHPTFANPPPPAGLPSNATDAELLRGILQDLVVVQGKYVVMVAHSAGGGSTTEAATQELLVRVRKEKGEKGGVLGLLYVTAFAVCKEGSASGRFGEYYAAVDGKGLDCFKIHENNGLVELLKPEVFLYNDPVNQPSEERVATFPPILPAAPQLVPLVNSPYAKVATAYLKCLADNIIPLPLQEAMIAETTEKEGAEWTLYESKTGHAPHLTDLERTVEIVKDWVEKCLKSEL